MCGVGRASVVLADESVFNKVLRCIDETSLT